MNEDSIIKKSETKNAETKNTVRHENHLVRIALFINERFPPISHGLFGFVSFYSFYFLWQVMTVGEIVFKLQSLVGALTISLMLLLLRVFDELKDYETDLKIFPERPLPSGRVSKGELIALAGIIIALNHIMNLLVWDGSALIYFGMFAFVLLATKWFFVPKLLSNNIVLAFITHQPYVPLSYAYVAYHAASDAGDFSFGIQHIMLIVLYWSAMMLWELSRKIRAPGYETDYQTYSMAVGWKRMTGICLVMAMVMMFSLMTILLTIEAPVLLILVVLSGLIMCCFRFLMFLKRPSESGSKFESYVSFVHLSMQGGLLLGLPIFY